MTTFIKCFSAEMLKLRRTLTFWMVLIAPFVIVMLNFGMWLLQDMNAYSGDTPNVWMHFFHNLRTFWVILMLPLFIALETALLASVEHSAQQWRRLYTLPVARGGIYAAKLAVASLVVLLASLILVGETYLAGAALDGMTGRYPFLSMPMPVMEVTKTLLLAGLCSFLMVSIHTWISLHFHNFTVGVGVGMAAAIANIMLVQSDKPWTVYFPWLVQLNVIDLRPLNIPLGLGLGVGGGLLVALLGGWLVTRKDVM